MKTFMNELKLYGDIDSLKQAIGQIIVNGEINLSRIYCQNMEHSETSRMMFFGCDGYDKEPSYISDVLEYIDNGVFLFELRFGTTVDVPIEWIKYLTKKTDVSISFIGEDSNNEVVEFYRMDTHILPKKDSFKRTYFEDERDMSEYLREIGYFEYDLILRNKYYEKIGLTDLVLYKGKVHAIEDVLSKSWDNINLTENAIILIDNKPTIVSIDDIMCIEEMDLSKTLYKQNVPKKDFIKSITVKGYRKEFIKYKNI